MARDELDAPHRDDPLLDVISRLGHQHEQGYLESLKADGLEIVEIAHPEHGMEPLERAASETLDAMKGGVDVVYQATFFDGTWRGHGDFLCKVSTPSHLGPFSYEIYDTKLARKAKAAAVLQLCLYSDHVARLQGTPPEHLHLVLGDRTTQSFKVADYSAYYRRVKSEFEATMAASPLRTYPDPVDHCSICRWLPKCARQRRVDRHLSLVADMRRDQIKKLNANDVNTIDDLAESPPDRPIKGVSNSVFERLQDQAAMQLEKERTGASAYKLLDSPGEGYGLHALPAPSAGDVFFDIEADTYAGAGGLEYLFGWIDGDAYEARWAHDAGAEKAMFEAFIDFVTRRFKQHPDMHVYHYASYETTAIKRLMSRYGTREDEVDRLLRAGVFVDLFRIVKQSLRVSEEGYSIKDLEVLYGFERTDSIGGGGASIVEYELYLETRDQSILDRLAEYNEADCRSLVGLRDWLEGIRNEAEQAWGPIPRPPLLDGSAGEQSEAEHEEVQALMDSLTAGIAPEADDRTEEQKGRWLLAHLLGWHRREEKSDWWAYFERASKTPTELLEDRDTLAVLTYEGIDGQVAQSNLHRYSFPDQESKIDVGDKLYDTHTSEYAGLVASIDYERRQVWLRRGKAWDGAHPLAVGPGQPPPTKVLRRALRDLAEAVIEDGVEGSGSFQSARHLLLRKPPVMKATRPGADLLQEGEDSQNAARRIVHALDHSYLPIQGPPGTGKTYMGARMITSLVREGKKVGITGPSHKVIANLLAEVCKAAAEEHLELKAVQKCDADERCDHDVVTAVSNTGQFDDMATGTEYQVVAGTAWAMARPALREHIDVLFVDEAGQFSLANTLAVSTSARSVVLLGDPQQLDQPVKGIHPEGAGASALAHILSGQETIPPQRGLFLEGTFRMHPAVTKYVSDAFYEGRLGTRDGRDRQVVDGEREPGIHLVPVSHEGNRIFSMEEAETVAELAAGLIGKEWTDPGGHRRPLTAEDLIVVAPFNAQVARLRKTLPAGVPVGTVDKFQGQEGVVAFYSLTTSSPEDIPRNFEFLYSRNRLNVAVSRARSFAVVVCNPEMLLPMCNKPEHMRLANALCLLAEHSVGAH